MGKLQKKLKELFQASFPGSVMQYDPEPLDHRIMGTLIWSGFAQKRQIARQNLVWGKIRKALSEKEQAKVLTLFTLTPREAKSLEIQSSDQVLHHAPPPS